MMSIGTLTNPLEYEMLECLFFWGVTLYSYMLCSNWPSKHNMRLRSACRVCRGKTKSIDWQLALSMSAQWANVPAFLWRNPMLISCATPSQARISKQGGSWNQRIVMVVLFTVSVDSEEYQRLLLGSASSSSSWQVAKDAAAGIEASDHILVIPSFSNIQNNMCDTLQASWTILRKYEIELIMKWRCIWYSTYSRMVGWWSFEAFFGGANPPDCHWGRSRRGRVWYLQLLEHLGTIGWYCWWTKSCTTKDDDYPIIYKVFFTSQVVVWDFCHQQYQHLCNGLGWKQICVVDVRCSHTYKNSRKVAEKSSMQRIVQMQSVPVPRWLGRRRFRGAVFHEMIQTNVWLNEIE